MSRDLLFELGTEELPSGAVWPLAKELGKNLSHAFTKAELSYGEVQCFATPRRLAVIVKNLDEKQPDQFITRKGPAVAAGLDNEGHPTKALMGFARSCGVEVDELSKVETEKGAWWSYNAEQKGVLTADLLPQMVKDAVQGLSIPKPMRWGDFDEGFARPVHWSVLLFGDDVVDTTILGVSTGRDSHGHRFHHPQAVCITSVGQYESLLNDALVVADFSKRRNLIKDQVKLLAAEHNLIPVMPEELLDEVTSIVEWPNALMATFETSFLKVPAEALIASMQSHQKCFALKDKDDNLQSCFITISNIVSEAPEQVISGNEKVMRARLSDADFFFKQDKKHSLESFAELTDKVKFQERLGSLKDKTNRTKVVMEYLTTPLHLDKSQALRACELSKSDLMSGMVGEFPELQGLMGYYYALNDGEPEAIAKALYEQYLPRFSGDDLPSSPMGMALSLADRIDTLVGIFGIDQKPSGVKDPFKLRRHALAVVRLLKNTPAELRISSLIKNAEASFDDTCHLNAESIKSLKPFILDRLQSLYQSQNTPSDVVQAVLLRQDEWLHDVDKRIDALMSFIQMSEAGSLAAACKRVNNILQKSGLNIDKQTVQTDLFQKPQENQLFELIQKVESHIEPLYVKGDYQEILTHLAALKEPVDQFFEEVMVMADDERIKQNRLCLLNRLQILLKGVADISRLNTDKS